jgi:hypothetical protein
MPPELQGAWCYNSDNGGEGVLPNGFDNMVTKYDRTIGHNRTDIKCTKGCPASLERPGAQCNSLDSNWIVIGRNGYEAVEAGCDVANSFVAGTEGTSKVNQVNFKDCGGEGDTWNESWRTYVDTNGRLNVRAKITKYKDAK